MQKEYVSKQERKSAKAEPSVYKDPLFDEIPEDTLDYMKTEDAQDLGRTRDVVDEEKENVEDVLSTTQQKVSTDKEKVSTNIPIVSTDGSKVSTDKEKVSEPNISLSLHYGNKRNKMRRIGRIVERNKRGGRFTLTLK
ncbi:hypothetical protein Tco_0346527 [Tanacetum coccineum]